MIIVRYTCKWLSQGYEFPCDTSFESWAEYRSWRSDMEDLYGRNFRVLNERGNKPIREAAAPSRWSQPSYIGTSGKVDGSTDACILGLDY
jgi:hypothetical protein